jgi:hypothetical protein
MMINKVFEEFIVRNGQLKESHPLKKMVKIGNGIKVKEEFILEQISLGVYYG